MAEQNEGRDNFLDGLQKGVDIEGLRRVGYKVMNAGGPVTSKRRELSREEVEALVLIDNALRLKQKAGRDGEFNRV